MKRAIVVGVLVLGGCVTSPAPLTPAALEAEPESDRPAHFMGNIRQALSDHVDDCAAGLSFTARMVSRGVAADWTRFLRTLD